MGCQLHSRLLCILEVKITSVLLSLSCNKRQMLGALWFKTEHKQQTSIDVKCWEEEQTKAQWGYLLNLALKVAVVPTPLSLYRYSHTSPARDWTFRSLSSALTTLSIKHTQSWFMGLELKGEQMEAVTVRFGTSFTYQLVSRESKWGITLTRKGTCAAGKPPELFFRWFPALRTQIPGNGVEQPHGKSGPPQ